MFAFQERGLGVLIHQPPSDVIDAALSDEAQLALESLQ
jgi:hypothetical protein